MRKLAVTVLAVLVGTAASATDRVGYRSLAAGDFAGAAQRLEAERRIHPRRPELMLNLAAAYRALGRNADAEALYADVLARPAVTMDLSNGTTASSRDLAALALSRRATAIASR